MSRRRPPSPPTPPTTVPARSASTSMAASSPQPSSSSDRPRRSDDDDDDVAAGGDEDDKNVASLRALEKLSTVLASLDDSGGAPRRRRRRSRDDDDDDERGGGGGGGGGGGLPLSHWRVVPPDAKEAYEMFEEGSKLTKATSTKYALVGKIDKKEGSKLSVDLRKGCELIASAAVVLHDPSAGCSRSARSHSKKFARSVLATVISLIRSYVDGTASEGGDNNVGARRTGAVWDACDRYATLPKGNRNAMRRDLMVWTSEVLETTEEFGGYLELGPAKEEGEQEEGTSEGEKEEEDRWDDFCEGNTDQYVARELPIVEACVGLMKCTKGSLNLATKALEAVGKGLPQEEVGGGDDDDDADDEGSEKKEQTRDRKKRALQWMSDLHELARASGEGVTDLGACLYPPLRLESGDDHDHDHDHDRDENDGPKKGESTSTSSSSPSSELERQIDRQRNAVLAVTRFVLGADADASSSTAKEGGDDAEEEEEEGALLPLPEPLPGELTKMASRIAANATARGEQATEALRAASETASSASSTRR